MGGLFGLRDMREGIMVFVNGSLVSCVTCMCLGNVESCVWVEGTAVGWATTIDPERENPEMV